MSKRQFLNANKRPVRQWRPSMRIAPLGEAEFEALLAAGARRQVLYEAVLEMEKPNEGEGPMTEEEFIDTLNGNPRARAIPGRPGNGTRDHRKA